MLLNFTVGNFMSFKDKMTLTMEAASIKDFPENIVEKERFSLLTSAVIYGANASGKSNFLKAMAFMRNIVRRNFDQIATDELPFTPFLLSTETLDKPTFFEIEFLIEDVKYRYGFENNNTAITAEWLFEATRKAEKPLFLRVNDGIEVKPAFKEGKNLEEKTRDNALFLIVVYQFNGEIARKIFEWFKNFNFVSGLQNKDNQIISLLKDPIWNKLLLDFYKHIDLGFDSIKIEEEKEEVIENMAGEVTLTYRSSKKNQAENLKFLTTHKVFDTNKQFLRETYFDADKQESSGTQKVINNSAPVFLTLQSGGVLIVDELDAKLHPNLTFHIVKLFQNKEINTKGAQLIFATHNTEILGSFDFRRDQIYFIEKDRYGSSNLYSLVNFTSEGKVRKDRSFDKDYIKGRYGAIPYFGNYSEFVNNFNKTKSNGTSHQG